MKRESFLRNVAVIAVCLAVSLVLFAGCEKDTPIDTSTEQDADMVAFTFEGIDGVADIDRAAHSVSANAEETVDLTAIVAEFTLSTGATATVGGVPQVSKQTANNFTSPVTYTITSGDGETTHEWTVAVTGGKPSEIPTAWTVVANNTFGTGITSVRGIAFGAGKFVAVGSNRKIAYSTDGVTWTAVANTGFTSVHEYAENRIQGIAYGGGKFVAVGTERQMTTSTDGISWTAVENPGFTSINGIFGFEITTFTSITYGNGKFVAAVIILTLKAAPKWHTLPTGLTGQR